MLSRYYVVLFHVIPLFDHPIDLSHYFTHPVIHLTHIILLLCSHPIICPVIILMSHRCPVRNERL